MGDYVERKLLYGLFPPSGIQRLHVADIDLIPAANVRPVVYCRECAFWSKEQDGKCGMFSVESTRIYTPPDGYCFAGIRREDANK